MIDFNNWLAAYAEQKGWKLITDTSYGLNVESDEQITDAGDAATQDEVFYNVIESGSFDSTSDIALSVTRNFEIGLFRRCVKETSGEDYYNNLQDLIRTVVVMYRDILNSYESVYQGSYETAVDELDSNNVMVKLNFSISDSESLCQDTDVKSEYQVGYETGLEIGHRDGFSEGYELAKAKV